jgi:hypothetical protein
VPGHLIERIIVRLPPTSRAGLPIAQENDNQNAPFVTDARQHSTEGAESLAV